MIDPVIPLSPFSPSEVLERAVSHDEREWVPAAAPNVWMRPLLFDMASQTLTPPNAPSQAAPGTGPAFCRGLDRANWPRALIR